MSINRKNLPNLTQDAQGIIQTSRCRQKNVSRRNIGYVLKKLQYFFYSSEITFGVESAESMQQQALLHVVAKNLYNQDIARTPIPYGVLDPRMGTNQKESKCQTCGKGLNDCPGHFGYVNKISQHANNTIPFFRQLR